jgi:ArsR family transcriptional regulator, arsenate/arsenite/antimonite-responsive transcriptional repressor
MLKHMKLLKNLTGVLDALSDPTRLEIVRLFMKNKEMRPNDITAHFKLSRPAISHHLNLMRRLQILKARKEGKEVLYSFNKEYVTGTIENMLDFLKTRF